MYVVPLLVWKENCTGFFFYQDLTILAKTMPVLVLAAQVILLSESPNNFLYYVITLFQPHILQHEVRRRHC
jgi:hypothetical protein